MRRHHDRSRHNFQKRKQLSCSACRRCRFRGRGRTRHPELRRHDDDLSSPEDGRRDAEPAASPADAAGDRHPRSRAAARTGRALSLPASSAYMLRSICTMARPGPPWEHSGEGVLFRADNPRPDACSPGARTRCEADHDACRGRAGHSGTGSARLELSLRSGRSAQKRPGRPAPYTLAPEALRGGAIGLRSPGLSTGRPWTDTPQGRYTDDQRRS